VEHLQISLPERVDRIITILQNHGYEAYAVGGCVRDSVLGREPEDWDITTSAMPEETKALFKMVSKKLTAQDVKKLFEDGRAAFNSGKYDDAEKLLLQVLSYDEKNQDALYFMGRVYHQSGKKKKAQEYYQKVLDVDDKTGRATEARTRMRQLGQ